MMRRYPFPRGQGRIIDSTPFGRLSFPEQILPVECVDGFTLLVHPNDLIGRHLYLTGQFDRTIVEVLLSHAASDDQILDIGANVGYVSCSLLRLLPACRLAAVEPQPKTFELLSENLSRVGSGRGKAVRAAVSDSAGVGLLELRSNNTGASRLVDPMKAGRGANITEVPLISGPGLFELSGLDRVDLVKIDVEGHEAMVIRSLMPILERYRPRAIVFEHGGHLSADSGIRQDLERLGYQIHGIRKRLLSWGLVPLNVLLDARERCNDYVALSAGARV
jgi:FkbM family methyltransferase